MSIVEVNQARGGLRIKVSCLAEGPKPGQEEIQCRDRQSQGPDSVGLQILLTSL